MALTALTKPRVTMHFDRFALTTAPRNAILFLSVHALRFSSGVLEQRHSSRALAGADADAEIFAHTTDGHSDDLIAGVVALV